MQIHVTYILVEKLYFFEASFTLEKFAIRFSKALQLCAEWHVGMLLRWPFLKAEPGHYRVSVRSP